MTINEFFNNTICRKDIKSIADMYSEHFVKELGTQDFSANKLCEFESHFINHGQKHNLSRGYLLQNMSLILKYIQKKLKKNNIIMILGNNNITFNRQLPTYH